MLYDHVDFAVIEDVVKCSAAAHADHFKAGSLDGGHQLEFAALEVMVGKRAFIIAGSLFWMLVHFRINVAVYYERVLAVVVIVVEETIGETNKRDGGHRDVGLIADICREPCTVGLKKDIVVAGEASVDSVNAQLNPFYPS